MLYWLSNQISTWLQNLLSEAGKKVSIWVNIKSCYLRPSLANSLSNMLGFFYYFKLLIKKNTLLGFFLQIGSLDVELEHLLLTSEEKINHETAMYTFFFLRLTFFWRYQSKNQWPQEHPKSAVPHKLLQVFLNSKFNWVWNSDSCQKIFKIYLKKVSTSTLYKFLHISRIYCSILPPYNVSTLKKY